MKKISTKWFYLSYFLLNLINVYILMTGVVHPNLSNYKFELSSFIISLIGNLGILGFFFVLSFILFPKTKSRNIFILVMSFVFTFLCIGLAVFTAIFSTFFKFSHLDTFNSPSVGNYIVFYITYALKIVIMPSQAIHLLPFLVLVIIFIFTNKSEETYHFLITKLAFLLMSLVIMIVPFFTFNSNTKDSIYENSINGLYGSNEVGAYDFYIYDLYRFLFPEDYTLTSEKENLIEEFLLQHEQSSYVNPLDNNTYSTINEYTGLLKNKNLLIIQLEAINDFVVNLSLNGLEVMPTLSQLANNGIYFNNFFSTAGIGNTSDVEFSSLTGLYGNGNDLTIFRYAGENYETLAKDFNRNSYDSFSLHGNTGKFYLRDTEHFATLGFKRHYDLEYFSELDDNIPMIHSYLTDEYFFTQLPLILEQKDRYFAYAITLTSHSPFVPSPDIPTYDWGKLTNLGTSYLNYCRYLDNAISLFLDMMEDRGLLDDLVIVLYGDHTSSLFKKDYDAIFKTKSSAINYRRNLQKVPFIIYNQASLIPQIKEKVCGTSDVYRTLANLFDLSPKYYFGFDMMSDEPGFIYSPRNLDIWFDGGVYLYPSQKSDGDEAKAKTVKKMFEKYKYYNDLILRSNYFK